MHHRNCPNNICSATESSPRCHIGCWWIGMWWPGELKEQNIWYMFVMLELILSIDYQKVHIYIAEKEQPSTVRQWTWLNTKEKSMPALKYKRKNTPALKYQRKNTTALKNGQNASQRLFQFIPGMQKCIFKCIYWAVSAPQYTRKEM